jgi:hypothetical protein
MKTPYMQILIKENGKGFMANLISGLLRLHSKSEFDGAGLALSRCKRF